jgi:hypothetical protein
MIGEPDDDAFPDYAPDGVLCGLAGKLIDYFKDSGNGLAPGASFRPAGHALCDRVHPDDAAEPVGGDNGVSDAVESGPELGFLEQELFEGPAVRGRILELQKDGSFTLVNDFPGQDSSFGLRAVLQVQAAGQSDGRFSKSRRGKQLTADKPAILCGKKVRQSFPEKISPGMAINIYGSVIYI